VSASAGATAPLLEARGLTVRFGGLVAVRDVSLRVEEGASLGIIGPNGAGKTTLVNLVSGHLHASAGTVLIDGRDHTGAKPWQVAAVGVARTFQIVKPFRHVTVRENVAIGAMFGPRRSRSVAAAMDAADAVLERVGLAAKAEARPGALGVADAKRLELAKALALRPRLLLLDEVMAGLRPQEVDQAAALLRSLHAEGVAIVAVEHVMKAILAVTDHVFVMHQGTKLVEGPPQQVMADAQVIEAYLGERYARRHRQGDRDANSEAGGA